MLIILLLNHTSILGIQPNTMHCSSLSAFPLHTLTTDGTGDLSSPIVAVNGLQTCSQTYQELVATAIDRRRPACNQDSAFPMTDYSPSHGDRTYHAEIIDIPVPVPRVEKPRDLTTLPTSSGSSPSLHKV